MLQLRCSRFTPGHLCKLPQFLCLLVETDNEALSRDASMEIAPTDALLGLPEFFFDTLQLQHVDQQIDEPPCISFHVLTDQVVPSTLKLLGSVWGREVVVLIDGGSTNNFIQTHLESHLGLAVQSSSHLK